MRKIKKKNLKTNISSLYILVAFFFIAGFGFFATSKFFLAENVEVNQTELNKEYDLHSNGKFTINEWTYDSEKNLMEIILVTNGIQDFTTSLDFTAVPKSNIADELPTEVVFNENDIFILHVKEIPKKFDQLALRLNKEEKDYEDIFEKEDESEEESTIISTIYTDHRVVTEQKIRDRNLTSYAIEITENLISESNEEIKKLEEKIAKIDEAISSIEKEIERLQVELLYQTVDEQVETNNNVFRLEKEIEQYQKDKEELNENVKNLQSKVKRLQQKKYDLTI